MSDSTAATKPDGETTMTDVTDHTTAQTTNLTLSPGKGKGKGKATAADDSMDIDEDEDDEDDDDDDDEDDEEEEEEVVPEDYSEIDPSVIQPGGERPRRNRTQVDYSSAEAHAKAGLKPGQEDDED